MTIRTRLLPEQRRDHLLDVGEHAFTARSYEGVSMQDLADEAGVTRSLVYHYFPTKAEYFAAIWTRAHERIAATGPAVAPLTVRDEIERALRAYLAFYADHLPLLIIANRSVAAYHPAVRGSVDATFLAMSTRCLDVAGARRTARARAEVGFVGWIAFVRESTLQVYLDRRITPAENLDLCLAALDATVGAHADLSQPWPR